MGLSLECQFMVKALLFDHQTMDIITESEMSIAKQTTFPLRGLVHFDGRPAVTEGIGGFACFNIRGLAVANGMLYVKSFDRVVKSPLHDILDHRGTAVR